MSHTLEVCLKYGGSLEELKTALEQNLGVFFPHYEAPSEQLRSYQGRLLTIDISLSVNYLETDRDLNFSDFQYVLGTRVAGQVFAERLRDLQVALTDTIGLLACFFLDTEVMVTVNVERLYARYYPESLSDHPQGSPVQG